MLRAHLSHLSDISIAQAKLMNHASTELSIPMSPGDIPIRCSKNQLCLLDYDATNAITKISVVNLETMRQTVQLAYKWDCGEGRLCADGCVNDNLVAFVTNEK